MATEFDQLRNNPTDVSIARKAFTRFSRFTRVKRSHIDKTIAQRIEKESPPVKPSASPQEQLQHRIKKEELRKTISLQVHAQYADAQLQRMEDALLFWRSRAWTKTQGVKYKAWIDVFFEKSPFFTLNGTQGKLVQASKNIMDQALIIASKVVRSSQTEAVKKGMHDILSRANPNDPIEQYIVLKLLEISCKQRRSPVHTNVNTSEWSPDVQLFQSWWNKPEDTQAMNNWALLADRPISSVSVMQYYSIQRRLRYRHIDALEIPTECDQELHP